MPRASEIYGQHTITEKQLHRLFAIAHGSGGEAGVLGGNKRDRVNQLWEIVQSYGYNDWDCVDENGNPSRWLKVCDYDEIVAELQAMRGGL